MIIKGKFLFIMSEFFYPKDLYKMEIDTNNIPFQEIFNTFLRRLFKCVKLFCCVEAIRMGSV